MSTYWSLLEMKRGSELRLTRIDDDIYTHFRADFSDFDLDGAIDEDEMKSPAGKERWRRFINAYEKRVDDFNFGTMIRARASHEYGEKESIFGESNLCFSGESDMVLGVSS